MSENTKSNLNPTGDKRIDDFIASCSAQGLKGKALDVAVSVFAASLPKTRQHTEISINREESRVMGAVGTILLARILNKRDCGQATLDTVRELLDGSGYAQRATVTVKDGEFVCYVNHSDINGGYTHGKSAIDDKSQNTKVSDHVWMVQSSGDNSFASLYAKVKGLYQWFSPKGLESPDLKSRIDTAVTKGTALLAKYGISLESKR